MYVTDFCHEREHTVQTTVYTDECYDHEHLHIHFRAMDALKTKAICKLYRDIFDIIEKASLSKDPA